jgi:Uma2 family endonuclease
VKLEDYLALPEDSRVEIVDGVIRPMSRELRLNRQIGSRLTSIIEGQVPRGIQAAPEEIVVFAREPPAARIPDVVVFRDLADPQGKTNNTPAEDVLLVVEIVSPHSANTDRFEKKAEYARCGIQSFWLIEPQPEITVHVHNLAGVHYGEPKSFGAGESISDPRLPWLTVSVADLLGWR